MKRKMSSTERYIRKCLFFLVVGVISILFLTSFCKKPVEEVYEEHIIKSGETLWSIASKTTPEDKDIRTTIEKIKLINELDGCDIDAGQMIIIPRILE